VKRNKWRRKKNSPKRNPDLNIVIFFATKFGDATCIDRERTKVDTIGKGKINYLQTMVEIHALLYASQVWAST
jgi:hypothetical protein